MKRIPINVPPNAVIEWTIKASDANTNAAGPPATADDKLAVVPTAANKR